MTPWVTGQRDFQATGAEINPYRTKTKVPSVLAVTGEQLLIAEWENLQNGLRLTQLQRGLGLVEMLTAHRSNAHGYLKPPLPEGHHWSPSHLHVGIRPWAVEQTPGN